MNAWSSQACIFIMMIQLIQFIVELVSKGDTEKSPGLWTNFTCRCKHVTSPYSARMYVTSARMSMFVHGRGEQEGNYLTRYWNLRICKLHVINCNFVADYWDTALMKYFVTNVVAAPGYGWSVIIVL